MKLSICDEFIWKCTRIKWLLLRLKQNLWKRKKQISKTRNKNKKNPYTKHVCSVHRRRFTFLQIIIWFFFDLLDLWLMVGGTLINRNFEGVLIVFLMLPLIIFHIWFISEKVEQEKKYLVHLSLLRELMTP